MRSYKVCGYAGQTVHRAKSPHVSKSFGHAPPHVLPCQPLLGLQRTFGSCFCQARILSAGAGAALVLAGCAPGFAGVSSRGPQV